MSVTGAKEAPKVRVLDRVPCLCYHVQFQKDKSKDVLALLDSGSEVNAITLAYATQLGLEVRRTNVGTQKIDKFSLATYSMVIVAFQVLDKLTCFWFFQQTFLLANISIEVVLSISLLTFSNVNI